MDHPRGPKPFPENFRPFVDPPLPPAFYFEDIPAGEWSYFFERENRLYSIATRLPIWVSVELPKHELVSAWLAIVGKNDSAIALNPVKAEQDNEVVYRTGLPGKPTSWHLIEAECRRRFAAEERHPGKTANRESRADWARVLRDWLITAHPIAPAPVLKTLTNKLSGLLGDLEADR